MRQRGQHHPEKGTAIVETAFILLLFFVLFFAIFEAGRLLNSQQVLTHAAREGARFSVAPISQTSSLPSEAEIEAVVRRYLDSARIRGAEVTVLRPVEVQTRANPPQWTEFTRVRVSMPYTVLTLAMFRGLEINLAGEAQMRNETSPD